MDVDMDDRHRVTDELDDLSAEAHKRHHASINGFVVGERIGKGGFSFVYRAYNHNGSRVAACKVVALQDADGNRLPVDLKSLQKEVQVHRSLKHVHILEFMDSLLVKPDNDGHFYSGLYMLMELAQFGDLFDKIAPDIGVAPDLAKIYFEQLIDGLDYIHSKGICHRDLKPENLLLGAEGRLKISDFGLCAVWKHQGKTRLLTGRCGSLPYVAPELNSTGGYHAQPIDIWGAGVVLFTLLAGNTPWDEPSNASAEYRAYLTGELLEYQPWDRIEPTALSLLLACLEVDPSKRITIPQIRSHPWLASPSQISKQRLPFELTRGLRQAGMMDIAEPRASQLSGMVERYGEMSQIDSQFMQNTGLSATIGGTTVVYKTLSRFRLRLPRRQTISQVLDGLRELLDPAAITKEDSDLTIRMLDNRKMPLKGIVKFRDDSTWPGDVTLVELLRTKGDPLEWKRFWWKLTKTAGLRDRIVKSE